MWRIVTKQGKSIDGTPEAIIGALRVESDLWFTDDRDFMHAVSHHTYYLCGAFLRTEAPASFLRSMHEYGYLTIYHEA
jgi:hypothetical protein